MRATSDVMDELIAARTAILRADFRSNRAGDIRYRPASVSGADPEAIRRLGRSHHSIKISPGPTSSAHSTPTGRSSPRCPME